MSGVLALGKGLPYLFKKGIRRYTLIPFLINLLLFAAMLYFGWEYINQWADQFIGESWLWKLLGKGLKILTMTIYLFAFSFVFSVIANVIASPFNSLLAEKIEQKISGQEMVRSSLKQEIKKLPSTVVSESSKLLYIASRGFVLLIISLTPILNLLSPILWFVFGAKLQTLTYLDYPAANNNIRFKHTQKLLSKNRLPNLGFGMVVVLLTMVPIVNFIVMPIAVAGATWLWTTEIKPKNNV